MSAHFDTPPVAGATATLVVKVRDPLAAINGLQLDFGDGSRISLSSCRPASLAGPLPDVFKIGKPATFSIEHVFETDGQMTVNVVATSGDCTSSRAISSLEQKVRVLPGTKKIPIDHGPLARISGEVCPNSLALPGSLSAAEMRASVICLVSTLRQAFHLSPVKPNKFLTRAAQRHASDMVAHDYFSHNAPDGTDLAYRLKKARFKIRSIVGENIGAGTGPYASPLGIVIGWYWSASHRANMLEPGFKLAGVGVAPGMPMVHAGSAGTYDLTLASPR